MKYEELGMRNEERKGKREQRERSKVKAGGLFSLLFIFCYLLFVSGCSNPFMPPNKSADKKNRGKGSVRIYISESGPQSRTVQPARDAIQGYQLTFGPGTHVPVNITNGNYADVTLANTNWTITATAYRKGGTIGVSDDAVASGFINVTLPGDVVSGTVPPVILKPLATGSGTLHYDITVESGVSGYVKLWEIDGINLVSTFGTAGVLNLTDSATADFTHTAGRYIIEVKLTNEAGNIAFRREAIEIWKNTSTAFIFAPTEYLDPDTAVVANSRARLSETDTKINNQAIGIGTGNGNSEQNPKTYVFNAADAGNVSVTFVFETDSFFATAGWAATTGTVPGAYSETALPSAIDFSTNNVFWIKAVSEDRSETMYYRFITMLPSANYGAFSVSASNAAGVSYTNPNLTITQNGTYIISMRDGVTSTTVNKIKVTSGVNTDITLSGVHIDVSGTNDYCAFDMSGATVNLTLDGENILKSGQMMAGLEAPTGSTLIITEASTGSLEATGGDGVYVDNVYRVGGAGIGGSWGAGCGTIIINGGTVTAVGSSRSESAGIGGGGGAGGAGVGGTIIINDGTVTATGGSYGGAGIGGGGVRNSTGGAGGTVTINGGIVTATASSSRGAAGIGGGAGIPSGASGSINISGNAVLFASSIQPTLTSGGNVNNSIVFIGNTGTMYGNVSLDKDVTIPSDRKLVIKNGQTLIIESGYTLTNNGTIWVEGNIEGTIASNPPIRPAFTVSGGSTYTYVTSSAFTERVLTITDDGTYTISMKNGVTYTTTDRIVVDPYVNATITLSDIHIDVSGTSNTCAFNMSNATINLILVGTNVLKSGNERAGLQVPAGATLVITSASTGSLVATGGQYGAGIGSGRNSADGTISINGGTVTAIGGSNGAGIGGGSSGGGGTITISGSTVTAIGGSNGAGIGGGSSGGGGTITISGSTVTATGGGNNGAGIGGGSSGAGGTIAINGNAVIFASSIQPTLTEGDNVDNAIVFRGNAGTVYGDVTLSRDVTFAEGKILVIPDGKSLTIPDTVTLTNDGAIYVRTGGTITGTVMNNQPIYGYYFGSVVIVDMYDSRGNGWDHSGALRISVNGTYISNARLTEGSFGTYTFLVASGDIVNIYWTGSTGIYHSESAFIVYYADTPPSPSFNGNSWSGINALLFRAYNSLSISNINQLLGSFVVP